MEELKDWTIMIYMAGDNNLSADMAYALADIREAMKGKSDHINLMVYYDGAAIDAPTIYCDFTDPDNPVYCPAKSVDKPFRYQDQRRNVEVHDENSGAAYPLMNFVNWCVNDTKVKSYRDGETTEETKKGRKAKKYAFILSGHSSAFQNLSLMVDSSSNYYMTIPKLRWALEQITKKEAPFHHGISLLKQEIDILGFDSCVMGMAELAYEFGKSAKVMVASEGNLPSAGWSYVSILSKLICPETGAAVLDEKQLAKEFVRSFIEKQNEFLIGGVSVDISALDLADDKIGTVIENLNELGRVLYEKRKDTTDNFNKRLENVLLLAHLESQSYMFEQNVDLKDFCEILLTKVHDFCDDADLTKACQNLIKAIDDCVLMCGFSGGAYQFSNGIAAFFPWTYRSYGLSYENYKKLKVLRGENSPLKHWNEFLDVFTYNTKRQARYAITDESKSGVTAGHDNFFPAKNNGIANDRFLYMGTFGGNGSEKDKNTGIGNDKNTGIGNDKNTGVGNDKNTGIGNDKNTGIGNDKNTGIGNDKNTGIGNDKNTGVGNDKNTGVGNDKNTGIGNDKNTGIGNDKNTGIGNDKGVQQFMMVQFKNIFSMWNISGFTKQLDNYQPVEKPEDKSE